MTPASLFWGMMFGVIGLGYFMYGKKQGAVVPLICGLVLMVFPYFIENTYALLAVGGALSAAPFFIKL